MNRIDLLIHEWDFTYDKEDWYPPIQHALSGLTAAQASWRPPGEAANTIWENVSHLLYYKERFLERLKGNDPVPTANNNDDTFANVGESDDEEAWQATLARLKAVHEGVREVLTSLTEKDFDRPAPTVSLGTSVTSIIMHDAYHTGQIVQIRKLQGSWPSRRSFD